MIEVEGLSKRFGRTVAVDQLSFTVRAGVVTGFLGPNGAGKSTTLRMLLGLDHPDAGTARFDGAAYPSLPRPLTQVGSLLDASFLHPSRSARNHLRALAASNRIPARRVDEVLDLVGLSGAAKGKAGSFSLGMKQRLGLAGALLGDPGTLLLDEPANGLDPEGIRWMRSFLSHLAHQGRTVFVSSHLLAEVAQIADDVVVIGRGRLVASGSVAEFVARFTHAHVRVRTPQAAALADRLRGSGAQVAPQPDGSLTVTGADAVRVGEAAAAAGVVLHELTTVTASLEDAFLAGTAGSQEFRSGPPVPPTMLPGVSDRPPDPTGSPLPPPPPPGGGP